MGGCAGKESSLYDEFIVTNINDQHRLVHSGIMYVTESQLIYIDKKSHEKWEWPLKFLRRYGCEGPVFSFEAGRKCPSGEGLYAFNCKKANALFNRVAQNISQGNLEPTEPELPERNAEVPFPPKVQQSSQPTVPNGSSSTIPRPIPDIPPVLPPTPPPTNGHQSNVNYTDLEFKKGIDNKPPPSQSGTVNYSKIDMPKTIEVSRYRQHQAGLHNNGSSGLSRRQTTGNITNKKRNKGGSRSSSCSSSSSLNTDHQQIKIRSLDDDHRSLRKGSAPDLRISSQQQRMSPPLLPATLTETPSENDADPYKTSEPNYLNISVGTTENQHNYSNMNVGVAPITEQNYANINVGEDQPIFAGLSIGETRRPSIGDITEHNYSNITVGMESEHNYTNISVGVGDDSVNTLQQSNYQNIIPGQGLVSSTPVTTPIPRGMSPDAISPGYSHTRSNTFNHSQSKPMASTSSSTLPMIKGGGNTMQTYIELDITNKSSNTMTSYAELEISSNQPSSLTTPGPEENRQRSQSALIQSHPTPEDTQDTLYKELNFNEMETLRAMAQDREQKKNAPQSTPAVETDKKHKSKK